MWEWKIWAIYIIYIYVLITYIYIYIHILYVYIYTHTWEVHGNHGEIHELGISQPLADDCGELVRLWVQFDFRCFRGWGGPADPIRSRVDSRRSGTSGIGEDTFDEFEDLSENQLIRDFPKLQFSHKTCRRWISGTPDALQRPVCKATIFLVDFVRDNRATGQPGNPYKMINLYIRIGLPVAPEIFSTTQGFWIHGWDSTFTFKL